MKNAMLAVCRHEGFMMGLDGGSGTRLSRWLTQLDVVEQRGDEGEEEKGQA